MDASKMTELERDLVKGLEGFIEDIKNDDSQYTYNMTLSKAYREIAPRLAELEADAARWRYMLEHGQAEVMLSVSTSKEFDSDKVWTMAKRELNEAIDALIAKEGSASDDR